MKATVTAETDTTEATAPVASPTICGLPLRYVALCALVLQTTAAVLVTRYSRDSVDHRQAQYAPTTVVLLTEFTKWVASMSLVFAVDCAADLGVFQDTVRRENFAAPLETLKLAVPAALYTLQNNLVYVALSNLDATTFQVGYQSKVITTAVLSVCMLGRRLSLLKWVALVLLMTGIVVTQLDSGQRGASNASQNVAVGMVAVLMCAFSSALAGVYFEKILKGSAPTVWMRNAQLAFFSTAFAVAGMFSVEGVAILGTFFQGYTALTWALVLIQAVGGLVVALVVKYADNILKGFATAMSIVLCGVCSWHFMGVAPSTAFAIGSAIVIGATMLYAMPDGSLTLASVGGAGSTKATTAMLLAVLLCAGEFSEHGIIRGLSTPSSRVYVAGRAALSALTPPGVRCSFSGEPPLTPIDHVPATSEYHPDVFRFCDVCVNTKGDLFSASLQSPPTNKTSGELTMPDEVVSTDKLEFTRVAKATCSNVNASSEQPCFTMTPTGLGRLTRMVTAGTHLRLGHVGMRSPRTFIYPITVGWGGKNHGHSMIRMSSILKGMLARGLDPDYDIVVLWATNWGRFDFALQEHRRFAPLTFKHVILVTDRGVEVPVINGTQKIPWDFQWQFIDPNELSHAQCNTTKDRITLYPAQLHKDRAQTFCFRGWVEAGHSYVSLFFTDTVDYFQMITQRLRPKFGLAPIPGPAPTGVCTRRVATIVEREKNRMWFPADLAKLKAALTTASSELQREHNCSAPVFEVKSVLINAALPLDQQVKVFDESSYIIGMYGAGMYWMIFARANITLDMVNGNALSDYNRAAKASGNVMNWLTDTTGTDKPGCWNVSESLINEAAKHMKQQALR